MPLRAAKRRRFRRPAAGAFQHHQLNPGFGTVQISAEDTAHCFELRAAPLVAVNGEGWPPQASGGDDDRDSGVDRAPDARQNARREVTRAEGFDDNSIDRGIGAGVDQKRRHAEISLNELHIAVKTTDIVGFLSREAVVENDFSIDHRSHRPALGGKKGVHMIGVTLDNAAGGKNILIEKNHYPPLPGAGIGGDPDGAEKVADVIDIFFA